MRDEPHGKFVIRRKGKPVTAKRFHLYKDCGMIANLSDEWDAIDLAETADEGDNATIGVVLDLLGLTVCSACNNRAIEVSAEDVLADVLTATRLDQMGPIPSKVADLVAARQIADLEKHGYKIRRIRRGGT